MEQNGFKPYIKTAGGGKIYEDDTVIYVAGDGSIYMTPRLFARIGSPEYVQCGEWGNDYAIVRGPRDKEQAYKVQGKPTIRISCTGFTSEYKLCIPDHVVSYPIRIDNGAIKWSKKVSPQIIRRTHKKDNATA